MVSKERIAFFSELLLSCHALYIWEFSPSMHLFSANSPFQEHLDSLLSAPERDRIVLSAGKEDVPTILSSDLGAYWITLADHEHGVLSSVWMLGPFFIEQPALDTAPALLKKRGCSSSAAAEIMRILRTLPILSLSRVFEYAIMLYQCLKGLTIQISDLNYLERRQKSSGSRKKPENVDSHGTYAMEQEMLRMVREGDLRFQQQVNRLAVTGTVGKLSAGDATRQMKNAVLVNTVLFSRAAIDGGLPPETSLTLTDHYFQSVESCRSMQELQEIAKTMRQDFVQRVNRIRTKGYSRPITECCELIRSHLEEELSLRFLSEKLSYSEYYLSRRFKQEVGVNLNDYIRSLRLERAKELLRDSSLSVRDVSDRLHFCSQSYFTEQFRKTFGISPLRYRDGLGSGPP